VHHINRRLDGVCRSVGSTHDRIDFLDGMHADLVASNAQVVQARTLGLAHATSLTAELQTANDTRRSLAVERDSLQTQLLLARRQIDTAEARAETAHLTMVAEQHHAKHNLDTTVTAALERLSQERDVAHEAALAELQQSLNAAAEHEVSEHVAQCNEKEQCVPVSSCSFSTC
jgi:chromosome segregation ATPase